MPARSMAAVLVLPCLLSCSALLSAPDKLPSDSSTDDAADIDTGMEDPYVDTDVDGDMPLDTTVDDMFDPDTTPDPADPDADPPVDTTVDDVTADWVVPETWVTITAGTFTMGSPSTEPGREADEMEHTVTLTRDFEIQTTDHNRTIRLYYERETEVLPGFKKNFKFDFMADQPLI